MSKQAAALPILKGRKQSSSTQCTNNLHSGKALRSDRSIITCRICLEEGNPRADENAPVIKPCKCSGSLEIVHEICLREWINTILEKKLKTGDRNLKVYCEICKDELNYATGRRLVCRTNQEKKRAIYERTTLFVLCLIMMFLFLAALGGLLFAQTKISPSNSLYTLLIAGYVMTAIGFLLWLGKFVWTFCFKLKKQVTQVLPRTKKIQVKVVNKKQPASQSLNPTIKKMNGGVIVINNKQNLASSIKNNSIDPLNQNIQNPQFA